MMIAAVNAQGPGRLWKLGRPLSVGPFSAVLRACWDSAMADLQFPYKEITWISGVKDGVELAGNHSIPGVMNGTACRIVTCPTLMLQHKQLFGSRTNALDIILMR